MITILFLSVNNTITVYVCVHTCCLDNESLLSDVDMYSCLEHSDDPCLSITRFEWESPESDSLDHTPAYGSVQGHLRERSDSWLNVLRPSSFIEGVVTKGYQLPFIRMPDLVCMLNHKSALENSLFVTTAIEELVLCRCVIECSTYPIVSSPLSVVFNAKGKPRLVVDLRYINQFLPDHKLKYDGLNLVPLLFQHGDFFTTFDLKSGYHHVDIHEHSWPYGIMAILGNGSCFVCCLSVCPQHVTSLLSCYVLWSRNGGLKV